MLSQGAFRQDSMAQKLIFVFHHIQACIASRSLYTVFLTCFSLPLSITPKHFSCCKGRLTIRKTNKLFWLTTFDDLLLMYILQTNNALLRQQQLLVRRYFAPALHIFGKIKTAENIFFFYKHLDIFLGYCEGKSKFTWALKLKLNMKMGTLFTFLEDCLSPAPY